MARGGQDGGSGAPWPLCPYDAPQPIRTQNLKRTASVRPDAILTRESAILTHRHGWQVASSVYGCYAQTIGRCGAMANPEHVEIVKRGSAAQREWVRAQRLSAD